jgi:hypothetical protein
LEWRCGLQNSGADRAARRNCHFVIAGLDWVADKINCDAGRRLVAAKSLQAAGDEQLL